MKKIINKMLENKNVKKILFFGSIILVIAIAIVLLVLRIQYNNDHATLFIPEETEPQNQVQQVLVPKYTKTSTKSWANGAIFGSLNKELVTELHFVTAFEGESTGEWKFDGLQCYVDKAMIVYVVVGDGVIIENSMSGAFADLPKIETISGLKYLDTSKVSDMSNLFSNCSSLISVDVQELKTDSLVTAKNMFYQCNRLDSIDISTMNLQNLTNADGMFAYTNSLSTLYLAPMRNVTTMKNMFEFAGNGTMNGVTITGELTMGKCVDATEMFKNANVSNEFLSSLNTSSVKIAKGMFYETSLLTIDLSTWNMESLTDASDMFASSIMLQEVNVSNWNVPNLKTVSGMFNGDYNIKKIAIHFTGISVLNSTEKMFNECFAIESIDLGAFNGIKIGNAQNMFANCEALTSIYCTGFSADASGNMFKNCTQLPNYDSNELDAQKANATDGYFSQQ